MKIASTIARILLGILFVVFGLNGFLHFLPQPPLGGLAGEFTKVLAESHYMAFVFAIQLVSGILFLINRGVPLALTLIGPVIVNILLFHALMAPAGIGPGIVVTVLWILVFIRERSAFDGIIQRRPAGIKSSE